MAKQWPWHKILHHDALLWESRRLEQFEVLGFGRKKRQNSNDKQACNIGNFQ
ncbi:hypothetical protein RHMOL_Rhmol02G0121200 [Rhododendron molle]|uniref:Uncharacterized protein n=1 Tax=Rhododendron molle TaxID=49168 RepID=A0ACC0PQK5_RHOML|nr:hypothetical protein RHMOL_Rhmol02G0121200 [Rhododendron molle]